MMRRRDWTAMLMLGWLVFASSLLASEVQAQEWNFDPECAGSQYSEALATPSAAMLMLDYSLSMQELGTEYCCDCPSWHVNSCDFCCGTSLWTIATQAIDQAFHTLKEELYFGLGFFGGSRTNDSHTYIALEASETSNDQFMATLDARSPSGETPTHRAIRRVRESATLNSEDLAAAGVLITDGYPGRPTDWPTLTIEEACLTREAGQMLYIVGLGGATNSAYNNKLAAAAGTGCCGDQCEGGTSDDPCVNPNVNEALCEGSYQAYNQAEFRDVLLSIGEEIACTFPLNTEHWPEGIPDDFRAVKVEYLGENGVDYIAHRSVGNSSQCEGDETCHSGMCRDLQLACNSTAECEADDGDNFCHPRLGCEDKDDRCAGDGDCDSGDFCWLGICKPEDLQCNEDSDCESDELCDAGYCRDLDDFCRVDSDCLPEGDDKFCHEFLGCEDESDRCETADDCDNYGDFCWHGICSSAVSGGGQCSGGGWYFASSNRQQITLTTDYCARVRNPNDIQYIETHVACSCESMYAGQDCMMSEAFATACPVGTKVCREDQTWFCEGPAYAAGDECPFYNCPDYEEPQLCHVENSLVYRHHPVHASFEDEGDFDALEERNRCQVGVVVCDTDQGAHCEPLRPMPELCDGMDNDCDGRIDNLSTSWSSEAHSNMSLPPDYEHEGAACYEQDVCFCPGDAVPRHGGLTAVMSGDASFDEEWQAYLNDWRTVADGGCMCQPALSY